MQEVGKCTELTGLAILQCLESNTVRLLLAVEISNYTIYFFAKLLSTLLTSIGVINHVNFIMSAKVEIIIWILLESALFFLPQKSTFL